MAEAPFVQDHGRLVLQNSWHGKSSSHVVTPNHVATELSFSTLVAEPGWLHGCLGSDSDEFIPCIAMQPQSAALRPLLRPLLCGRRCGHHTLPGGGWPPETGRPAWAPDGPRAALSRLPGLVAGCSAPTCLRGRFWRRFPTGLGDSRQPRRTAKAGPISHWAGRPSSGTEGRHPTRTRRSMYFPIHDTTN